MSKEKKQKLKEYQKNIAKLIKSDSLNLIKNSRLYPYYTAHFSDIFSNLSMHCLSSII